MTDEYAEQTDQHQVEEDEEYLNMNEVEEEVPEDDVNVPASDEDEDADMDVDGDDDTETLEIDMSNNSWAYFDQHKDSIFTIFKHPTLPMVVTGGGDNTAFMWTTHTTTTLCW